MPQPTLPTRHRHAAPGATLLAAVATALLLLTGCNKTPEPPPPATTVGSQIDDTVVTTRVKTALAMEDKLKDMGISVETIQGQVRLSGMLDSREQIEKAVAVARATDGALSVRDELTVKP